MACHRRQQVLPHSGQVAAGGDVTLCSSRWGKSTVDVHSGVFGEAKLSPSTTQPEYVAYLNEVVESSRVAMSSEKGPLIGSSRVTSVRSR
ncbi:hypothetical protein TIFTF001_023559 [Ficus carica]|uniref:Uncharacterized protein n=1 Tax=Ficus carica TaxID=3494 RepID=A0AA88AGE9_FICCA|nr:hypothetical protein TIFTF001_023559 [Ficus carica]